MSIKSKLQDWLQEDIVAYFDDRMDMLAQIAHDDKRETDARLESLEDNQAYDAAKKAHAEGESMFSSEEVHKILEEGTDDV
jgi:hypothetical protein